MSEEILINVMPNETRVAVVENGIMQELYIERGSRRGLVGNIYKGRVSRVLPGMQAAFVDIGLDRAAFLHASDIRLPTGQLGNLESKMGAEVPPTITSLLTEGQEVLVQVIKDPIGAKGARLTTQISIASRYLVYMPEMSGVGVSLKIDNEADRQRLKDLLASIWPEDDQGGYIIRTVAEGAVEADLRADIEFLRKLWHLIKERARMTKAGSIIHEDLSLVIRTMRDLVREKVERVRVDSRETYFKLVDFSNRFISDLFTTIEHYQGERPIFDLYGIEDEIQKSLSRKVQLKSGGYLIIDQTEAMATIDVNTGAFVGHRNLEETIFKTNLEAVQAICRQLRLRNLGGIIIIDFIDMEEEDHKRQVLRALEHGLEKDHAKTYISEVSSLGLVEMTRKRTRESLEQILCEPCPTCSGRGTVKTVETVCYEILREVLREAKQFEASRYLVIAAQEIVDRLMDEESTHVAELEAFIGKPIKFQPELLYMREQFDVVMM
ncbi:Rne/Rng family ribonuclease [Candidatus Nitrosoglobus terrae]|uniref:Ribonuclease G n=1 Tax=Candidatus Nitrosoglobus terrae TaxID=1630141 RepID=A0A1Q2SLB0_9GAMM|nr:ribonuclease G [Candidatus Nitrosoglobus terrae]BAW79908.1 Rne/Rng family ribonuclease [Candidatus Nitrosoglobus terrae]